MNSLRGYIIIAGAVLLAGTLIAYHPFQKPQSHFQFTISGPYMFQYDSTTGQVWVWDRTNRDWHKLPKLQVPKLPHFVPQATDKFVPPPLNGKGQTN